MNNAEARAAAARVKPIAEAAGFVPKLNREAWLTQMAEQYLWPLIEQHGGKRPKKWRVSVGFPKGSRTAIGQHWHEDVSADGTHEVFISPKLTADAPDGAVATLTHELVHAALPKGTGHKAPFKALAEAIGLTGKMTATTAGKALQASIKGWIEELGPYPHGAMSPTTQQAKPGSRLLKLECPGCGYVLRTTAKWLLVGVPTCCCGEEFRGEDVPEEG